MKKTKLILCLVLGFILGACAAVGVYFLASGEVNWQSYIENTLVPNIVAAGAAVGTLYIGSIPVLNLVKNAVGKFHTATEKITKTAENGEQNEKALAEYDKRISAFEDECDNRITAFEDRFNTLDEGLSSLITNSEMAQKMMLIGFCNMDELVKKGYAAEIGKVSKNAKKTKP